MNHIFRIPILFFCFILAFVQFVAAQTDMKGVHIERGFYEDQLRTFKTYDKQGHCTFSKRAPSVGMLQLQAVEYDEAGKPKREWTIVFLNGSMNITEIRYFKTKTETWAPSDPSAINRDPAFLRANLACTLEGFPNSYEELLQHPPIKAALNGNMYMQLEELLNAQGKPVKAIGYTAKEVPWSLLTYDYDANDRLMRKHDQMGSDTTSYTDHVYKYDANGNEIESVTLMANYGRFDTLFIEECAYLENRLVLRNKYQMGKLGNHLSKETFAYDKQGQLKLEELFRDGSETPLRRYFYAYDAQGRKVREEAFKKIDGEYVTNGVSKWEFEMW